MLVKMGVKGTPFHSSSNMALLAKGMTAEFAKTLVVDGSCPAHVASVSDFLEFTHTEVVFLVLNINFESVACIASTEKLMCFLL